MGSLRNERLVIWGLLLIIVGAVVAVGGPWLATQIAVSSLQAGAPVPELTVLEMAVRVVTSIVPPLGAALFAGGLLLRAQRRQAAELKDPTNSA